MFKLIELLFDQSMADYWIAIKVSMFFY